MRGTSSRTRRVGIQAGATLTVIYLVLAAAAMHPLRALGIEIAGVIGLWFTYAVRFAFNAPVALLPEVLWFGLEDRLKAPPPGGIVFAGSSTVAHWTSLAEDMAPLPVLNR